MSISDILLIGLGNIRRNGVRSVLTIMGVAVATGALFSMLSFGLGLQANILQDFQNNQQLKKITLRGKTFASDSVLVINDSTLAPVAQVEHVRTVFLDKSAPVRISIHGGKKAGLLKGLPASFSDYYSEDNYVSGGFLESDSTSDIILGKNLIEELLLQNDSTLTQMQIDSICLNLPGEVVEIASVTYDRSAFSLMNIMQYMASGNLPVRDSVINFRIAGVTDVGNNFSDFNVLGYVSLNALNQLPTLGFDNVMSLLNSQDGSKENTASVFIDRVENLSAVQEELKKLGFTTWSVLDNFKEIKRVFAIMNSILGAIGIMALFIATLGLVNTMIMSIYERTREIGILKSVGAKNSDIRLIFLWEAASIGFLGACFGIPLGWIISRIINFIFQTKLMSELDEAPQLFDFPLWLIGGTIVFSILFAMLAGFYPANRAARIDPIKALRHD